MVFDGTHQQIERVLRMGLDKFELRECELKDFDVVGLIDRRQSGTSHELDKPRRIGSEHWARQ
jgi:hypothetical protein